MSIHGQPPETGRGKNQSGSEAPRETTAGAGDGEPTPIPSSHPSLPTQYISERAYNNSQCGGGELWEWCVLILCTHLLFKLELSESNSPHDLSSCCFTSSSKGISPITGYSVLSQSSLTENYICLNVLC